MRPDKFAIDNCLKCSVCNAACPVYAADPHYPGPKHLGPELERLRFEGLEADTPWVEYCLGCHRCDVACPHQVGVSEMIARAKSKHHKNFIRALRDWWFARPGLLGILTTIVPAVSNFFLGIAPVRFIMEKFMRITSKRVFPAYTRPTLRSSLTGKSEQVMFFPGCFFTYNRPDLGRKVIALLARNGVDTIVTPTGCCGVPASANGDAALAHDLAVKNLKTMAEGLNKGLKVVVGCASCCYQLKSGFGGTLEGNKELEPLVNKLTAQTYDIAEYLLERESEGKLNTNFQKTDHRIAYHAPCHLNSQGIGHPWVQLLGQLPGVSVEDANAGCCGMSGTYGFKDEKYPISMGVGQTLFNRLNQMHPQLVATECATCQMQIGHGTGLKAVHPVEILLEAYDGKPL